ncbi:acetolactate synthase [Alternaria alternata]|nr:acetolactate synthase [Alternaria alternata]
MPSTPTVTATSPRPSGAAVHSVPYSTITAMGYTASFAFFEALWEYGVSHVFVNLGSDHPSIIEAIVKGQNEKKGQFPKIITCPNEVGAPCLLG